MFVKQFFTFIALNVFVTFKHILLSLEGGYHLTMAIGNKGDVLIYHPIYVQKANKTQRKIRSKWQNSRTT